MFDKALPHYQWNQFLGDSFGGRLSVGGITGAPNTEVLPGVTADTRTGVKITGEVGGRAGLDLNAGVDLGGFNANTQMWFGPTLTKPAELQVGRVYPLPSGGTIRNDSNLSISLPSVNASANAVLELDVDGRVDYGLYPFVPYDFELFNFDWDFDLDLFDFDFDLNLPDLPDFSFLGFDLPDFPDFPDGEPSDSLIRLKIPPSNPNLSLGEVQIVNPAKSFDVPEASFDGDTARFSVEGDLVRLGADLDGIITAAAFGNAILGTTVNVGEVGKLSYDLIDFKYGPELGFKYDAAITPELTATLTFSDEVLYDTGQGFDPTMELDVTWGEIPDIVLIGADDVNVDVTFEGVDIFLDHRGAFTLEDYLEIRALRLSAKLKGKFVNVPLGTLGPVIDERYSPLGDLFGQLEFPVFDTAELLGTAPVPGIWQDHSFVLNAAPVVLAYAADTTGPLDEAADWIGLDDHMPLDSLPDATLVVASGAADSEDLEDLQAINYTDAPSMTTEIYIVEIELFPGGPTVDVPVEVTHQDFDRIVGVQGFRVPEGSTYTIPSDTVRRLELVSLHNDGLVESTGFFELTSPGILLAITGEGAIDLQRSAEIDVQSLLVDAGQTIHFSDAGPFRIDVGANDQRVAQFVRSGFSVSASDSLVMGGELVVDDATVNVVAGQRLSVGPEGALRAANGASLAIGAPLLVNEGLVEAIDGAQVDINLTGNLPTIEGAEGSSFRVGAGSAMEVEATGQFGFEMTARNARFDVENGGILRFLDRVGVESGSRFDLVVEEGGFAELRGVRNYNEAEGFVTIANYGLLELTAATTSVRPQPPGFLDTDENQFTPTDLINEGIIRVIGDQSGSTETTLQFNATITNYVGGGATLTGGRWELLGAQVEYHNTPKLLFEPNGVSIIHTNVTDVMWDQRILNETGLDFTDPNTELWAVGPDAAVVFSGAARWDHFDTLRENRGILEFRDHHHFHTATDFANSGALTVDNESELDVNGTFTNRGGTAIFSGGSTLATASGVVVDGGLVQIDADSHLVGVVTEDDNVFLQSDTNWVIRTAFDPGDPENGIPSTVQPAMLQVVGRKVVANFVGNVVLEGEQASFDALQSLALNTGSLTVSAGNQLVITPDWVGRTSLENRGSFTNEIGRIEVSTGGSLTVNAADGIENQSAEVIVGAGSYLYTPQVNFIEPLFGVSKNRLHVDGVVATDLVTIASDTTLSGDGAIRGQLINGDYQDTVVAVEGAVSPGGSIGSLEVQGDYSQTSDAHMMFEVSGFGDTSSDQLLISGEALLDGVLDVSILDGYGLAAGQQFTVLSAGELIDHGLELAGSAADFFDMTVTFGVDGAVVLEFLGGVDFPLSGDYNDDGLVDARDYLVWRERLGETFELPNEGPGMTPGQVSVEDYHVWVAHYGESVGSAAGSGESFVPEPTGAILLLIGMVTALGGRRSTLSILARP